MPEPVDTLILELLEWIGPEPRPYAEVLDAWRTSCPRLPVWEEATERRLIVRRRRPGGPPLVAVSAAGLQHLRSHGRATEWDALTYDKTSEAQIAWASEVIDRLRGIAPNATLLDIGCGPGRVTETLLPLVPAGRVLAIDQSAEMVALARARLGERAKVWRQNVLDLTLEQPVDAIVSTATLHWVRDHGRLWQRLADCLVPGGLLEAQCGGRGNLARVRRIIGSVASSETPELVRWSPWTFAGPEETTQRLRQAGFRQIRCWLEERPTDPDDLEGFVRTSILVAHLARLPARRRERFARAVLARVRPPLDFVRLNVSAVR